MALNFPSSPTENQLFTSGVHTYKYNAPAWNRVAGKGTALPFNYFINPSFQISQQNADVAGTAAGYYPADQWTLSGNLPQTVQRIILPAGQQAPNKPKYTIKITVTTPKVTLAATGEYCSLIQYMEATRGTFQWNWGGSTAKQVVLRFWMTAPAGTISVGWRTLSALPTNYRAYHLLVTTSAAQANVWREINLVFPGDTVGNIATYPYTTLTGQILWIDLATSTGYNTPPGAWASGNFISATGMTNGVAASGAVFQFADFGVYLDPNNTGVAPPFEMQDDASALIDCQRYWYRAYSGQGANNSATLVSRVGQPHPVTMRQDPQTVVGIVGALTCHDIAANSAATLSAGYSNYMQMEASFAGTTFTVGRNAVMLSSAATNYLAVSGRG